MGGERCPVSFFNFYISKRPLEVRNTGRFYLTAKTTLIRNEEQWYYNRPMGHNTIAKFMKCLVSGTEFEKTKKLTNHSGRKTLVKRLKASKIPESSIIKVTGHTSTNGLHSYDPGEENEFREMSNALNVQKNAQSPFVMKESSMVSRKDMNCEGNFIFNDCQVTINNNNISQTVTSKKKNVLLMIVFHRSRYQLLH